MQTGKTALIAGANGLTGGHLLDQLLEHPAYQQVISLVRRPTGRQHPKLREVITDFDHPDASLWKGDDVFCALGTTLAKAGSKEAQYRIDCLYPVALARVARDNGAQKYLLVSSIGADPQSSNFYLRTKGDLEQQVAAMGYETFVAARPSFLMGQRGEFRLGERIGIVIARILAPLMVGPLRKYRGIASAQVAKALIAAANDGKKGRFSPEYDELCKANTTVL